MHWIHDIWEEAEKDPWARWRYTTAEGGRVTADELAQAAWSMSRIEFDQEFEASFEAVSGRVYQDFSLEAWPSGNVDSTAEDPGTGPVLVGFDPGMHCGVVLATRTEAGDVLVFDGAIVEDSHTAAVADDLSKRFQGRRLIAYPDPAGKQRRSSAGHLTDNVILRQMGFRLVVPHAAPPVADRVNVVRTAIFAAEGRRRLRVHPRANVLLRALDSQRYDPRTQAPDKKSGHDHVLDALGYLCWSVQNPLREPMRIGQFQVGHGGLIIRHKAEPCTCYGCRHGGTCARDRLR